MKLIIQRCLEGSVSVDGEVRARVGAGLVVLLGIAETDEWAQVETGLRKLIKGRFWPQGAREWQRNVVQMDFEILLVPQFTLFAAFKGAGRLDFHHAMKPDRSGPLFARSVEWLRQAYRPDRVQAGCFGAHMRECSPLSNRRSPQRSPSSTTGRSRSSSNFPPNNCTEMTTKTMSSSRRAFELACSMTGVGLPRAPPPAPAATAPAEEPLPARAPAKFDALDYSRFEEIVRAADEEAPALAPPAVDKAAVEAFLRGEPSAAPSKGATEQLSDTSAHFDLRKSAAFQGCAHDRSKERALYERPNSEKLHIASRFRQDGNVFFKDKDYQRASGCYLRGLIQLEYTFPDTPAEEEEFNRVKLALHLNQAAAKLNLEDYDECHVQCEQALKMDPKNPKALYRSALCKMAWHKYDQAIAILSSIEDESSAGERERLIAKARSLEAAKPDASFYSKIFSRASN